jgi:transposase
MNFIGIDLHTNRFTYCYRTEGSQDKRTETFELNEAEIQAFFATLTADTSVLIAATITTFSFTRLFQDRVKEVLIAHTYELRQISLARTNTNKLDADKLCRLIKMQVLSGEQTISPVTLPPQEIQDLRGLFSTYRLLKRQNIQLKNRIHSLLKEQLYGFTHEKIFTKQTRERIRNISVDPILKFQLNFLLNRLERDEADGEALKEQVLLAAVPFVPQIDILTSMKGVSVFIAIAIIADIIDVSRFKDSKHFTSCLRSTPPVANSNTSTSIRGINKKGRKLSATLLTQSLNHVLDSSLKLRKWYDRLTEYKKARLVRTGLRRRVFAEIFQMLKKRSAIMAEITKTMKRRWLNIKSFWKSIAVSNFLQKLLDISHRRSVVLGTSCLRSTMLPPLLYLYIVS